MVNTEVYKKESFRIEIVHELLSFIGTHVLFPLTGLISVFVRAVTGFVQEMHAMARGRPKRQRPTRILQVPVTVLNKQGQHFSVYGPITLTKKKLMRVAQLKCKPTFVSVNQRFEGHGFYGLLKKGSILCPGVVDFQLKAFWGYTSPIRRAFLFLLKGVRAFLPGYSFRGVSFQMSLAQKLNG